MPAVAAGEAAMLAMCLRPSRTRNARRTTIHETTPPDAAAEHPGGGCHGAAAHDPFDAPTTPETHRQPDEQRHGLRRCPTFPSRSTDAPPLAPEPGDGMAAESPHDRQRRPRHRACGRAPPGTGRGPPQKRRLRLPLPVLIVLLLFICGALLGLRKDIVRHVPQMASFYAAIGMPVNLRGLVFHDVKISNETHDGVPVLVVEGVIASTVGVPVDVPRIRFALRNAAGAEVYSWTAQPSQPVLEPGEAIPFRSRLASPPADGQDLQVRFFTRRDAASGAR